MPLTGAPGEGRLVEVEGTRLFVVEMSMEGPALLVLHGGPGSDHWEFGEYLDALSADLRLVLFDQRGHGMSDPAEPETMTLEQLGRDAAALADALELGEHTLLGHSFGRLVALQSALAPPRHAARLILSCTVPSARWFGGGDERPAALRDPDATDEELAAALEEMLPSLFADPEDERIGEYARRTSPHVLRAATRAQLRKSVYEDAPGFDDRLGEIGVPTLVLAGRHDRTAPVAAAELMAERIPAARLLVLEASAHVPFVEETEAYLDAVRSFVTGAA